MSRELDLKALISHIVRGDGVDKCRICMGDTSEGQVYLGDTVMMDGERAVTLAELLEVITGVEVEFDGDLPQGLCRLCSESALAAFHFRQLCKESSNQWTQAISFMANIQFPSEENKVYYVYYNTHDEVIIVDQVEKVMKKEKTLKSRNSELRVDSDDQVLTRSERKKRSLWLWQCPDCCKKFSVAVQLNSHLKNTKKRACNECGLVVSKSKFHQHLCRAHGKIVYPCGTCYQLFEDEMALNMHIGITHGKNSHQCKVCGNGYSNERALSAHMYSHSLFHCQHCGRSFENRNCYVHHQRQCQTKPSHPESSEYICDHCGNSYTKKPSLRIHIIQKHLNVLPYVCETCGKRTSTIAHMRSHEKVHTLVRKTFQCHCGAKMRTELGYQLHLRIHTGERPYKCKDCGDKFLSASRRLDHIKRRHRSAKDMPHGCSECSARFVRPFELKKHYMSVHSHVVNIEAISRTIDEEKNCPQGACVTCTSSALAAQQFRLFVLNAQRTWSKAVSALSEVSKAYAPSVKSLCTFIKPDFQVHTVKDYASGSSKTALKRLRQRLTRKNDKEKKAQTHSSGPYFNCTDCGKSFFSPYFLRLHLRNSGTKEACLHCGAVLSRGLKMKEHLESVHGEALLLCKQCPLLLGNDIRMEKHVEKAHSVGATTCNDCGRWFSGQSSLEVHSLTHIVRTCRRCGMQFTNRNCYRSHWSKCRPNARRNVHLVSRKKRSNIRDPATFNCDYCEKSYLSRPQLKNHIVWIHMDVRPHQCKWCGMRFYTPSRLAEHTLVHSRERYYTCDICGAKLSTKAAATHHRRIHTGEKPYECEDCGESFLSYMRRHEHAKRRHGKGPKINCMQCPASFVRSHELKRHMEKFHRSQGQNVSNAVQVEG